MMMMLFELAVELPLLLLLDSILNAQERAKKILVLVERNFLAQQTSNFIYSHRLRRFALTYFASLFALALVFE
jgi:hypothetical protein